jgi:hypothetical protein
VQELLVAKGALSLEEALARAELGVILFTY